MSMHLSYEDAVLGLKKALAVKGEDYVYEWPQFPLAANEGGGLKQRCAYFTPQGAPSCIVGHVMADLGHTVEDLDAPDGLFEKTRNVGTGAIRALKHLGYTLDYRAVEVLANAQALQDLGRPWGRAVTDAIRAAENSHE